MKSLKSLKYIMLIITFPVFMSCVGKGAAHPAATYVRLLTGECLNNTELVYYVPDSEDQQLYGEGNGDKPDRSVFFTFGFSFDLNHNVEKMSRWKYRDIPADELFDSFGKQSDKVREEYEAVYETYEIKGVPPAQEVITFLYEGGISLVADKEFAGYPAGTDLGEYLTCSYIAGGRDEVVSTYGVDPVIGSVYNIKESLYPVLNIPMDYISMPTGDGLSFNFPIGNSELVEEEVTFELKIPVKVVMYLNWINDKISDPDAPVPYKDEVLHCTFTTRYGLK